MRILKLSLFTLAVSTLALSQETLLDEIRTNIVGNPREMEKAKRDIYVNTARLGKDSDSYATRYESTRFLIEAGDSEAIHEQLALATNYEAYVTANEAWNYFESSTNPDLIIKLVDALKDEGPARLSLWANEILDVPSSVRAAMAITTIIAQSNAFSPEVAEWATRMRALEKAGKYELLRERARSFTALNIEALRDKRYSDAVVPPDMPSAAIKGIDSDSPSSNDIGHRETSGTDVEAPEAHAETPVGKVAERPRLRLLFWATAMAGLFVVIVMVTRSVMRIHRVQRTKGGR